MKKILATIILAAGLSAAQCPSWVGRPQEYPIGTIVEFESKNYEAIRSAGNGWTAPSNDWFWSKTNATCTPSSSSIGTGSSGSTSTPNSDVLAAIAALSAKIDSSKEFSQSRFEILSRGYYLDKRDNQSYKIAKIGPQVWMAENIRYIVEDGMACYSNALGNCDRFGPLYTWDAAIEVCPQGWKLPSNEDWNKLRQYADVLNAGELNDAGRSLKSNFGRYNGVPGENTMGFNALPGGHRADGKFLYLGDDAYFWTSTIHATGDKAYYRYLVKDSDLFYSSGTFGSMKSVRCILE